MEGAHHAAGVDAEVDGADVVVDPRAAVDHAQSGGVVEVAEAGGAGAAGADRDERGDGGGPEEEGATGGGGDAMVRQGNASEVSENRHVSPDT